MSKKVKVGEWFSLEEFTASETAKRKGIDNSPTPEHLENIKRLTKEVLDPVRQIMGKISITSGYRSYALNNEVGGVLSSAHCTGNAADIYRSNIEELFEFIRDNMIYDQVILESKDTERGKVFWVHVSYVEGKNRGQSFRMHNHKRISPIVVSKKWN
jgi:hypothetical protein